MPLGHLLIIHFKKILTLLLWEIKKAIKILLLFFSIKIFFNWIVNYFEFGLGWKFEIHLGWPSKPTHLMGFETEPTAWDLGRAGHA